MGWFRKQNISEEAARKLRSEKILKREGLPFINHLPSIESKANSTRRAKEDVVKRAIALSLVAEKGAKSSKEIIEKIIEHFQITDELSRGEEIFIKDKKPSQLDMNKFFWRYESLAVLLWALGFLDKLTRPEKEYNPATLIEPMATCSRSEFMAKAKLRPQNEILDAADLIYRYHWAIKHSPENATSKYPKLNRSVIFERLYSLNWLIGYMGQDWDEITTDT